MSLIVTNGSSYISATVNGTPGITYSVSNGNETAELLTGETVYFDNLDPSTEYPLTISREYKMVKNIRVKGTTQPLSIAEVRSWLWDGTRVENAGTATQSSTNYGGVASRALDLNGNLSWSGKSVTHTKGGSNNWWNWELTEALPITKITLWGRKDCCQSRIKGAILMAYDTDGNIIAEKTLGTTTSGQVLTVQV